MCITIAFNLKLKTFQTYIVPRQNRQIQKNDEIIHLFMQIGTDYMSDVDKAYGVFSLITSSTSITQ